MNIIKTIINLFKKPVKDRYLEYLIRETGYKWEPSHTEKGGYFYKPKNFYVRRRFNGEVKSTRNFNVNLPRTRKGPYCRWFECDEYHIHKYFR